MEDKCDISLNNHFTKRYISNFIKAITETLTYSMVLKIKTFQKSNIY